MKLAGIRSFKSLPMIGITDWEVPESAVPKRLEEYAEWRGLTVLGVGLYEGNLALVVSYYVEPHEDYDHLQETSDDMVLVEDYLTGNLKSLSSLVEDSVNYYLK